MLVHSASRHYPNCLYHSTPISAAFLLYDALPHQCRQCGFRFSKSSKSRLDGHLDWHFRQNRKLKDKNRRATSRGWYLALEDWVRDEEPEQAMHDSKYGAYDQPLVAESAICFIENQTSNLNVNTSPEGMSPSAVKCPLLPTENSLTIRCDVCKEKLETLWDDQSEEWNVKGAVRGNGKVMKPRISGSRRRIF